ncbi:MAG TPA: FAD-dependent oxidoreductase [Candidatus Limnocylindrales bacterium]|nr:FAD-dependent oxidoreductase [Candidatus Limnocylindrales bacterium]
MRQRLVLVGAGHTHVLVLRRWIDTPVDADVTIVTAREDSTYSGMVPGVIAGNYRIEDARIAVRPLAGRARAAVIIETAQRVDPERRVIQLSTGAELAYDVASLDVGSAVRGLDTPGVREHAIATRPIDDFDERVQRRIDGLGKARLRIAVVGGGAAGVEVSFVMRARLAAQRISAAITLVCGKDGLLPGYGSRAQRLVMREASKRGITIDRSADVERVDGDGALLFGRRVEADLVVWATGPAAPALIAASPLPHDSHGFVSVAPTLAVAGTRALFAAGDCATIDGAEWVPKAGVHAVREAPLLEKNLRAAIAGAALEEYVPQRSFLSLLNLGDDRAIATKWGLAVSGRMAWRLKDRIDRGFVRQFR